MSAIGDNSQGIGSGDVRFSSAGDLAAALRRARAAHGAHERQVPDDEGDWPEWYAAYMVAEQSGAEPPR